MRIIASGLVAAVALAATASHADVKRDDRGWHCGGQEDWEVASLRVAPQLILNNFFFEEGKSFRSKMRVLRIKYSALNRRSKSYNLTGQFVGFDKAGKVTLAMSSSPSFDAVKSGTETANGSVYVVVPVLPKTTKICASFALEG